MRVLVVAEDARRRERLARSVEAAGQDVGGSSDARDVMRAVRDERPEALLVESDEGAAVLRALLERARAAAEAPLPALLLLPESSVWLHGPLPAPLLPARALPSSEAPAGALRSALAAIAEGSGAGPPAVLRLGALRLDRQARVVSGPQGEARLTASECALLGAIVAGGGAVVRAEQVAGALWGRPVVDTHSRAAIRSHVHTLRRKLAGLGLGEVVVSLPGVGYRAIPPDEAAPDEVPAEAARPGGAAAAE